jgi:excinuclease UvrABC ATPase subunit
LWSIWAPAAGINGGTIVAFGTPEKVANKSKASFAGQYLKDVLGA